MQVLYTGSNWNLEMFQFCGGSESGVLREKPWSNERTNSKLNSYIMVLGSPGIKPWRHLWEAIALTTVQSLLLTSVSFIVMDVLLTSAMEWWPCAPYNETDKTAPEDIT